MSNIVDFASALQQRQANTSRDHLRAMLHQGIDDRLCGSSQILAVADVLQVGVRPVKQRQYHGPSMHTFVFRSYNLIVSSNETDLARNVHVDIDKAEAKLKRIPRQIQRDRGWAAARAELLSLAETKRTAVIDAAIHSED